MYYRQWTTGAGRYRHEFSGIAAYGEEFQAGFFDEGSESWMSGDTHAMAIGLQMFSQRHERLHITYALLHFSSSGGNLLTLLFE